MEFEYTFLLTGHTINYNYVKIASELKGLIIMIIDGKEVLKKDVNDIYFAEDFGLSKDAVSKLKASTNNISLVNYIMGFVPFPQNHALLLLGDFVENMLFFRSLDYHEFMGLKEGGSNIEEYIIKNKALLYFITDF